MPETSPVDVVTLHISSREPLVSSSFDIMSPNARLDWVEFVPKGNGVNHQRASLLAPVVLQVGAIGRVQEMLDAYFIHACQMP